MVWRCSMFVSICSVVTNNPSKGKSIETSMQLHCLLPLPILGFMHVFYKSIPAFWKHIHSPQTPNSMCCFFVCFVSLSPKQCVFLFHPMSYWWWKKPCIIRDCMYKPLVNNGINVDELPTSTGNSRRISEPSINSKLNWPWVTSNHQPWTSWKINQHGTPKHGALVPVISSHSFFQCLWSLRRQRSWWWWPTTWSASRSKRRSKVRSSMVTMDTMAHGSLLWTGVSHFKGPPLVFFLG